MNRKKFIRTCGLGCLGFVGTGIFLESCAGSQYIYGTLKGSYLDIPLDAFAISKNGKSRYRKHVIARHESLSYPIYVYRQSNTEYTALFMRCTHQGTELQAFGDRLLCSGHGSEFSGNGTVLKGPASDPLRSFPVVVENEILKIDLT